MFEEIVGTSPALKDVLSSISQVARAETTVLITGKEEAKEVVARAIHRHSDRALNIRKRELSSNSVRPDGLRVVRA